MILNDVIPTDLKRQLKEKNVYVEFIRLIEHAYKNRPEVLLYHSDSGIYSILKWFDIPIEERQIMYNGAAIKYTTFLDMFNVNWKK